MIGARQFRGATSFIFQVLILWGRCVVLTAGPYSGGDGTSNTPYLLSTPADLLAFVDTSADWDKWFVLTTDLDLQSTSVPKPIGVKPLPFTGVFDGARHSLKGLVINDTTATSDPLGLFGVLGSSGLIERLRLIALTVKSGGPASVAALVGQTNKGATVQQCSVESGSVATPASDAAGGLVGDNGGTVRECFSSATINALGLAGGLLGRSTGTAENCSATASVTTTKQGSGTAAGGLAGASVGATFRFCLATGLSITSARPAGLLGYADPNTIFTDCICNEMTPRAVENWTADVPGSAACEDANNLKSAAFFTGLGWDLKTIWQMDATGTLRLRWMAGSPTAVIKAPSGTIRTDPATGLAKVALDGTQSVDPNGSALKYNWQCLTADGGPTNITIDSVASPTVSLPVGTFEIQLTVNNGSTDSAPTSITITVGSGVVNNPPTAVIKGPTGTVQADATGYAKVALDGSQSSDPDKNPLTYTWKCLTSAGAATGIAIASVAGPTVSLPVGTYKIQLTVNDGSADSAPVSLTITVASGHVNNPPTAVIKGPTGTMQADPTTGAAKVTLDGSQSSDPDKDPLTYNWKCLTSTGAATSITIASVATPTVSLPVGTYKIQLTVNDGSTDSASVSMTVTVASGHVNTGPTAVIKGPTGIVRPDPATGLAKVALDATQSSDPDKDTLTLSWKCLTASGAATGITISSVCQPVVSLPAGQYRIELTVSDGTATSAPAVLMVTVNTAPTAEAGSPVEMFADGTGKCTVKLDGSKSSDPDKGQTLTYTWTCATANPTSASGATPSLVFPVGVHTVTLLVSDGVESNQDTVQVTVKAAVPAAKTAASPSTVGRTSAVPDVEFYLLLPAGKTVSNVDTQASITLDNGSATLQLTRDSSYSHKTCTVVAKTDRQKVLDLAGAMNGSWAVTMRVSLKTGETVCGAITLTITAGPGPDPAAVQSDRAYYYLDTNTWK